MKRKTSSKIIPLFAALLSLSLPLLGQEVSTDFSNYAAEEEIIVTFSDGPGNPKDWVGLYKQEMVAGEDSSLAWAYVDGTETGTEGLTEGELTFADGSQYEGHFRMNEICGHGKYFWPDGKHYEGEWSHNKMHGKGVLI